MVESAREVCGSVRVGEKDPKSVWWNYEIKATVRKEKGGCVEGVSSLRCREKRKMYGSVHIRDEKG